MNKISEALGTAVNVQAMVFGNMGDTSGTGVGFTRNPSTGEKEFYGEFLMNAQGEDVVAGIRTPLPIRELERVMPECYKQLREITDRLEKHYRDMQDFEFTIQEGRLYMLQTRNGKRTGKAAVKVAADMVKERLDHSRKKRSCAWNLRNSINCCIRFSIPKRKYNELAQGLPASPGAVSGRIVFSADDAVDMAKDGKVILVRKETVPDDIHGMEVAVGILTSRGGMTSHAAVVARGMGNCCIVGAESIIDRREEQDAHCRRQDASAKGTTSPWKAAPGKSSKARSRRSSRIPTAVNSPTSWRWPTRFAASKFARTPISRAMREVARKFGAEGIGLCRTEHMFFAEDRLPHVQQMILSDTEARTPRGSGQAAAVSASRFRRSVPRHGGLPVTIRLLDPPCTSFSRSAKN